MPDRLPLVLTPDHLPEPELRAAALDGQIYAVGDSWRSVAEIDDHVGRAIAAGLALGRGVVAAERTAAWVWGARGSAPLPHSGLVPSPARVKHRGLGSVVRQVVIDDDEITTLRGFAVTTPARTVVDLARRDDWTPRDETAARDVSSHRLVTLSQAVAVLDHRGRLPQRSRTLDRLERVCAPAEPVLPGEKGWDENAATACRVATGMSQPALTR